MAYTERGIFYQTDYNEDADILEDMEHMAKTTDDAIGNLSEDVSTSLINIFGIEVYEPTKTYAIGNMVIYDSKIYRCIAITTGEFDDTKWEEVSIRELIDEKYFKPNGGIPKSDLSSEVKTILEKSENKDNKVTELTEESTDEQYPSAKAVYDENKDLKTQVNTLKEITSQMPQVSDSGEEAYLADTIKAPFEVFEVKGHSEQETTEGKNKFYITQTSPSTDNGVTFTPEEDKSSLLLNGTATANASKWLVINANNESLEPGNYKLSSCGTCDSSVSIQIGILNSEKVLQFSVSETGTPTSFTISETSYINSYVLVQNGTALNNKKVKIMIVPENADATSYEPYTGGIPSPNPSYEHPVKSCGENVNILDEEWEQGAYSNVDGTSKIDSNQYVRTKNFSSIEPNKEYAFKGVVKSAIQISGDLLFYQEDGTFISRLGLSKPFTSPNNAKKIKVNFYNSNGIVPENVDYAKLEQGTVATPWSPYGMGCVNEKVSNKNWFKMDTPGTYTINGVTIKTNGDGSATFTGTATGNIYGYVKATDGYINTINAPEARLVTIPANTALTLSGSGTNVKCRLRNQTDQTNDSNGDITKTYDTEKQVSIMFYIISGKTVNETIYPMLELSSTATSYVPHEEQNISIPTQQPMRSIGEVEDEFVKKNNGKWYERHWISRKIFDGTEGWGIQNTSSTDNTLFVAYGLLSDNAKATGCPNSYGVLSNYFKKVTENIWTGYHKGIDVYGKQAFICVSNELAATTTDFKAWLAGKYAEGTPVYADYILREPTDILCTQLQSDILDSLTETVHTYKGGTYISSEDEVKARIKVSGLKDLNVMFEDLTNAIISQGANT